MTEARFKVHSGQASSRSPVTWWVRDSQDPKWPIGPHQTRENAEETCEALMLKNQNSPQI